MRYAIVIEKANGNYSAFVPDLPGCVATGDTVEEVEREIRAAIRLHLAGLRGTKDATKSCPDVPLRPLCAESVGAQHSNVGAEREIPLNPDLR